MIINPDKNFIADAVEKYSDTVFRVAFQYTRNRRDAEDILQEVFLQLIKTPPHTDADRLKAWLIKVTVNKCRDFFRAAKRRRNFAQNYAPADNAETFGEVFEALSALPEKDRNALYLHYYEGYTASEIAAILGGSGHAISKRICRAREKLKKFLEE